MAKWINGKSVIPQTRPTQTINWIWNNGVSGFVPVDSYTATGGSSIKTFNGLALASVKTINGLAITSVKSINGLV